jgi:putative sterol carrier protein
MSNLIVRNFREGDTPGIAELYHSSNLKSPRFLRSENYFKRIISYPGVSSESVFVAVAEEHIKGIIVISLSRRDDHSEGKIIEIWAQEIETARSLLERAELYCEDQDVDTLTVKPPATLANKKIFANWANMGQEGVTLIKLLSLLPLVQALGNKQVKDLVKKDILLLFDEEAVRIRTSQASWEVSQADHCSFDPNSIVVKMSSKTFLQIVFGLANPYKAYLNGSIEIHGLKNTLKTLKLLRRLSINIPWSLAFVDGR